MGLGRTHSRSHHITWRSAQLSPLVDCLCSVHMLRGSASKDRRAHQEDGGIHPRREGLQRLLRVFLSRRQVGARRRCEGGRWGERCEGSFFARSPHSHELMNDLPTHAHASDPQTQAHHTACASVRALTVLACHAALLPARRRQQAAPSIRMAPSGISPPPPPSAVPPSLSSSLRPARSLLGRC